MPTLTGKTAIITGASRGIGQAIAQRLGREGANTVLCARDAGALQSVAEGIVAASAAAHLAEGAGTDAAAKSLPIALDLRLPDAPAKLAAFALEQLGRIDIVVNNAGATKRAAFAALTDDDWTDGFALKFFGAVRLTRAAWPHLKSVSGSIVNISGIGGRTPGAEFTIGGSVNAAILSFTKAMADAGILDGVQVNAINPGTIRTGRFIKRLEAVAKEQDIDLAAAERHYVASAKITRIGEPEDIANLVAFVVGSEGRLLQGAFVDMDAGATKTL